MALKSIIGLDHVVVVLRDLAAGAKAWEGLGFTISPPGTHSPMLGTGNHTIMLGPDYIELLGVLTETEHNAPTRAFLDRRGEGIERAAFTATDAAAGVAEIRALGFAGTGPVDFGRPVTLPDGRRTDARFRTFLWPVDETPGGLRIFACQHVTRAAVWIPELQRHANTAKRIVRVEMVAADAKRDAEHMAHLIDGALHAEADGAWRVPTGGGRADFVFLSREALSRRHPGIASAQLPERGATGLVLAVDDLEAAARAVGSAGVRGPGAVSVAPKDANGVLLCFVKG